MCSDEVLWILLTWKILNISHSYFVDNTGIEEILMDLEKIVTMALEANYVITV